MKKVWSLILALALLISMVSIVPAAMACSAVFAATKALKTSSMLGSAGASFSIMSTKVIIWAYISLYLHS
jgi:hypothetical protein